MTDAPKRIWARPVGATKDWSKFNSGPWSLDNPFGTSTEYVRADIADEMMEALKEIERIYYLEGKNAIYRAAHMRRVAKLMISAVEDKAEGKDA